MDKDKVIKDLEAENQILKEQLRQRVPFTLCLICKKEVSNLNGKYTLLETNPKNLKRTTIGHLHKSCWNKLNDTDVVKSKPK